MASRFENTLFNLVAAWGGQIVSMVMTFATRAVFVRMLSIEYLGIESLFTNLLVILSLAELGVGTAITYALYKPIADNDTEAIKSLMRVFRHAYWAIGIVVAVVGVAMSPFLDMLIEDPPNIAHLQVYFLCFVANTAVSYFFSYKGLLLYAYQRQYVTSLISYGAQIVMCVVQMVILVLTHNYLAFLLCMIAGTLAQNIIISFFADAQYPYLKESGARKLSREELTPIVKNVLALTMHKVAGVAASPIGSVLVSKFVGVAAIAVYGNFVLLVDALWRILDKVFNSAIASVGNMSSQTDPERQYRVFQDAFFVSAVLYTVCAGAFLCCANDFVSVWLGAEYCYPSITVILLATWFFVKGMRSAEQMFTSAYGLFWRSWYKAIIETLVMVASAYVLVRLWGVNGVVTAGIATQLLVATTIEVHVLYKFGFQRSALQYVKQAGKYYMSALLIVALCFGVCSLIPLAGVAGFFVHGAVAVAFCTGCMILLYRRTPEFARFKGIIGRVGDVLGRKLRPRAPKA
ncbi:lipopolysaccharide biosynthesis protein [Adlercreutzia aquisgranensis]|uniref:lipopolysaccharide biosynthesis protein n=1 Tax=Adlercreutzia aquisgranensis TaxID=2941323 RepID=UPI002041B7F8|nr:hypothetical protein [Adlercreutzia aquisgranensis]